jgi:hypothetical protein
MDTPTFAWRLFELLTPVSLVGLTWLSVKAAQLADVKVKHEHVARALLLIDSSVFAAAREVQHALVDGFKAASPGGKLTLDQGAQAKQAALDSVKAQLGAQGLVDIAAALGHDSRGVDRILEIRIEAAVHQLKRATHVAPDSGTAGPAVPFGA